MSEKAFVCISSQPAWVKSYVSMLFLFLLLCTLILKYHNVNINVKMSTEMHTWHTHTHTHTYAKEYSTPYIYLNVMLHITIHTIESLYLRPKIPISICNSGRPVIATRLFQHFSWIMHELWHCVSANCQQAGRNLVCAHIYMCLLMYTCSYCTFNKFQSVTRHYSLT